MQAALAVIALYLVPGAAVAHADARFLLTQSGAGPGDRVSFSISGTENRATYSLEVEGEEVLEGSVAAESNVSSQFTMPDLGITSRAVTVAAQIAQADETTTTERVLQYLVPSQGSTGLSGPQAATVPTSAPAVQPVAATATGPRTRPGKRRVTHPAPAKRRVPARPHHRRHRPTSKPHHSLRAGHGTRARSPPTQAQPSASHGPATTKRASAPESRSPAPHERPRPTVATFLTGPPTPAILTLASGVASGGSSSPPIAAVIVLLLLGLTAYPLAGGPRSLRRPPALAWGYAGAVPHAQVVVPPDDRAAESAVPDDEEIEAVLDEAMAASLQEAAAAAFAPVTLAMVDQRAALATRAESKYVLDERTFEHLVAELAPHYLILEIDGDRVFPYDTVYFDTPARMTYHQHVQERRRRFKCRTRLYAAGGACFFEVKLKGGRGETIKRRMSIDSVEHGTLTTPALAFLERQLQLAYGLSHPADLAPVLRSHYRRLTLLGMTNSQRLTFDFGLMFAANGNDHSIKQGRILLETKSDTGNGGRSGGAGEAGRLLKRLGVRPVQSCSKYCLGLAIAEPELRDNRFRPLIRDHFIR